MRLVLASVGVALVLAAVLQGLGVEARWGIAIIAGCLIGMQWVWVGGDRRK